MIRVLHRRVLVSSVNSLMSASSPVVESSPVLMVSTLTLVVFSGLVSSGSVFAVIRSTRIIFRIVFVIIFIVPAGVMIITGVPRPGC